MQIAEPQGIVTLLICCYQHDLAAFVHNE